MAGRDASGKVLNVLAQNVPWFLGGFADLEPSNKTTLTYGAADHLRVHARRHGRRRGRPDAPAGGALGIPARHPGLVTLRPRGRQ
jgi:hypothetical protein